MQAEWWAVAGLSTLGAIAINVFSGYVKEVADRAGKAAWLGWERRSKAAAERQERLVNKVMKYTDREVMLFCLQTTSDRLRSLQAFVLLAMLAIMMMLLDLRVGAETPIALTFGTAVLIGFLTMTWFANLRSAQRRQRALSLAEVRLAMQRGEEITDDED